MPRTTCAGGGVGRTGWMIESSRTVVLVETVVTTAPTTMLETAIMMRNGTASCAGSIAGSDVCATSSRAGIRSSDVVLLMASSFRGDGRTAGRPVGTAV